MDDGPYVSDTKAGLLFLVWQQPTDRALTGWNPLPHLGYVTDQAAMEKWLREYVVMDIAERRERGLL